jgi:hypothetical protein
MVTNAACLDMRGLYLSAARFDGFTTLTLKFSLMSCN